MSHLLSTLFRVYRARNPAKRELVAIKVIAVPDGQNLDKRVLREVRVHKSLKHTNVLELIASSDDRGEKGGIQNWAGAPVFGIVLEYAAGGDLFDKIGTVSLFIDVSYIIKANMARKLYSQHRTSGCQRCWYTIFSDNSLPVS
jgi:serine/threonine protein kinase